MAGFAKTRWLVTWPSSDVTSPAVTVADLREGETLTFDHYRRGSANDLFDVRLYGDPEGDAAERKDYSDSLKALEAFVLGANEGMDALEAVRAILSTPGKSGADVYQDVAAFLEKRGKAPYDYDDPDNPYAEPEG